MELLIRDGDYVPDGAGGFLRAEGSQELLQRVLWKLSIRRGSFPLLPDLGSRLFLLFREAPSRRAALARQYAAEALAEEPVTVEDVDLEQGTAGAAAVTVRLRYQGESLPVTVEVPL